MNEQKQIVLTATEVERTLDRLAEEVLAGHQNLENLVVVGIRTGGAHLARRLADRISRHSSREIGVGVLDITLYRDDWTRISHKPLVGKTELPGSIDDQEVLLVDDVLFTGRTIRAALDTLIDYGRPDAVRLAVLIDRGHRELPIAADVVGKNVSTTRDEDVQVRLTEVDGEDGVWIGREVGDAD